MDSGVRGDFAKLQRFEATLARVADVGPRRLVRVVGRAAQDELQRGFAGSHDATGAAWKLTTDGRKALVTYGKHWRLVVAGLAVRLTSDHIGAGVHQHGATITPKKADGVLVFTVAGVKIHARKVTVPARRVTPRNGGLDAWAPALRAAVTNELGELVGVGP